MKTEFNKIRLFKNEELYLKQYEIQISIKALIELINNEDKSIKDIQTEFKKTLQGKKLENIPIEQRDYYQEHLIDRELIINQLIIKKRYSSCMLIFSVFEGILKEFCLEIERTNNFAIKIKDLKSKNDLSLYENYLTKIYELDFDKINPSFIKIKHQKITRNNITHKNGFAKVGEIQIVNGLELTNNQIIITSKIYFEYLINLMEQFFEELLIEIDKK